MKRFTTKLIAGLASLALVLTFAGVSSAQFAPEAPVAPRTVSLMGGFWVVPVNASNTSEGYLAFKFAEDGSVAVAKLDSQAKTVGIKKGTYRSEGTTLHVTLEGQTYSFKCSIINDNKLIMDGRPCVRITN